MLANGQIGQAKLWCQVCADVTWLTSLHNIEETKHPGSTQPDHVPKYHRADWSQPTEAFAWHPAEESVAKSSNIGGASPSPGTREGKLGILGTKGVQVGCVMS